MARDFDPLNPEKYDPNQFPALKPPPRAAVGAVSTPTVSRTAPPVAKPALVPPANIRSGFAPIVDAVAPKVLPQPASAATPPRVNRQARADAAYGNALFGPKSTPPATFQGTNLEVPTQAKPLAYRAGQAIPALVRTARAVGSGVVDVTKAASDVMSYPGRKAVNDVQQLVAGAQGTQAPAPVTLLRPNAAPPVAAPALAPAGTTMPRTKGSVMRDGRSAAAAVAATPAAAPAPVPAPDTTAAPAPAAAPVVRAAPTTALDGGGTFNGRPVADLLRNPKNPISIVPSGQMPAALTPAAKGLSPQQLGLTLPTRTAPAETMDRSGTFNGQSITTALRGVTNPASNVGASPNVPVAAPAEPAAYVTAPPQAGAPPTATAPVLTRRAFRSPDAMSKFHNQREDRELVRDVASRIDSELFRNSFAVGRGSRSARMAQAQLTGALAQLAGDGNQAASNVQIADDNNRTGRAIAGANNAAESQIAAANNAAQEQIAESRARSAERIADMQSESALTDDAGNVLLRRGAVATPVATPDGKPVRAAPTAATGQITAQDRLKALTEQLTAESASLQPNAERIAILQQQVDALTTGGATAPSQITATNPKTGERMSYNQATGQWEPIK